MFAKTDREKSARAGRIILLRLRGERKVLRCETITLPVVMMISLHHRPGTVSLAAFHDITGLIVNLKRPLLPILVLQSPHCNVLQGDDALWSGLRRVLEIVETPVI